MTNNMARVRAALRPERLEYSVLVCLIERSSTTSSRANVGRWRQRLAERLQQEFMKDSLPRRQELFRLRSYDRTVHPTQMYSLQAELALDPFSRRDRDQPVTPALIERAAQELLKEYLGLNVSISHDRRPTNTVDPLTDRRANSIPNCYRHALNLPVFWSDWMEVTPSVRGTSLCCVVMKTMRRMARILTTLRQSIQNPVRPNCCRT